MEAASERYDLFALALVLLQIMILFRISQVIEVLRGPRLLAACKVVQAVTTTTTGVAAKPSDRAVQLDGLEPAKQAMLERARATFTEAGGELDSCWMPFLLRFLIAAEWDETEALRHLLEVAAWRREHGAAAIRRKLATGFKLGHHPAFTRLLSSVGLAPLHRRSTNGDLLTVAHIGSLDVDALFDQLDDAHFADVSLHMMEALALSADQASCAERSLVRHVSKRPNSAPQTHTPLPRTPLACPMPGLALCVACASPVSKL